MSSTKISILYATWWRLLDDLHSFTGISAHTPIAIGTTSMIVPIDCVEFCTFDVVVLAPAASMVIIALRAAIVIVVFVWRAHHICVVLSVAGLGILDGLEVPLLLPDLVVAAGLPHVVARIAAHVTVLVARASFIRLAHQLVELQGV